MIKAFGVSVAAVAVIAGCDAILPAPQVAYFLASLEGAVEQEYVGSGTFSFGTRPTGQPTFLIYSRGEEAYAGHSFWIRNYDGGRLQPGTYPLELMAGDLSEEELRGIGASYRLAGESEELFVASSGVLNVTRSTSKVVEGDFAFTGFRYCSGGGVDPDSGESCLIPAEPPAEAPRITVTGSFRTVPAGVELRPDTP